MKITIEPTGALVEVDGLMCRVWRGHDEHGALVEAFVRLVGVPIEDAAAQQRARQAHLIEHAAPHVQHVAGPRDTRERAIDLRKLL
jgi:hypothetical protein